MPRLIKELRLGRVEFRTDKTANIHTVFGKTEFTEEQLLDNLMAILDAIVRAKPSAAKGQYIKKVVVASTMGDVVEIVPVLDGVGTMYCAAGLLAHTAALVITGYCRRWSVELAFFDSKQFLGLHDPQVWSARSFCGTAACIETHLSTLPSCS